MKPRKDGYYRCLWNEYARTIRFTWHRTQKGGDTIPQAYRYQGNVSSDYYHHRCDGLEGLEAFAKESNMAIDWESNRLVPVKD